MPRDLSRAAAPPQSSIVNPLGGCRLPCCCIERALLRLPWQLLLTKQHTTHCVLGSAAKAVRAVGDKPAELYF